MGKSTESVDAFLPAAENIIYFHVDMQQKKYLEKTYYQSHKIIVWSQKIYIATAFFLYFALIYYAFANTGSFTLSGNAAGRDKDYLLIGIILIIGIFFLIYLYCIMWIILCRLTHDDSFDNISEGLLYKNGLLQYHYRKVLTKPYLRFEEFTIEIPIAEIQEYTYRERTKANVLYGNFSCNGCSMQQIILYEYFTPSLHEFLKRRTNVIE